MPLRIFLDSDILFNLAENKRGITQLVNRLVNTDHTLLTSITVLGEIVFICMVKKEKKKDLHKIVDVLNSYIINFLIPNSQLRLCCVHMDRIDPHDRIGKTDKTHLAYAIAYGVDYYLTEDKQLLKLSPVKVCPFLDEKRIVSPPMLKKIL